MADWGWDGNRKRIERVRSVENLQIKGTTASGASVRLHFQEPAALNAPIRGFEGGGDAILYGAESLALVSDTASLAATLGFAQGTANRDKTQTARVVDQWHL